MIKMFNKAKGGDTVKTCETCNKGQEVDTKQGDQALVECRARPPHVITLPVQTAIGPEIRPVAIFPTVPGSSWCAEWEEKRPKLEH